MVSDRRKRFDDRGTTERRYERRISESRHSALIPSDESKLWLVRRACVDGRPSSLPPGRTMLSAYPSHLDPGDRRRSFDLTSVEPLYRGRPFAAFAAVDCDAHVKGAADCSETAPDARSQRIVARRDDDGPERRRLHGRAHVQDEFGRIAQAILRESQTVLVTLAHQEDAETFRNEGRGVGLTARRPPAPSTSVSRGRKSRRERQDTHGRRVSSALSICGHNSRAHYWLLDASTVSRFSCVAASDGPMSIVSHVERTTLIRTSAMQGARSRGVSLAPGHRNPHLPVLRGNDTKGCLLSLFVDVRSLFSVPSKRSSLVQLRRLPMIMSKIFKSSAASLGPVLHFAPFVMTLCSSSSSSVYASVYVGRIVFSTY